MGGDFGRMSNQTGRAQQRERHVDREGETDARETSSENGDALQPCCDRVSQG